jgi:hypothetical protein
MMAHEAPVMSPKNGPYHQSPGPPDEPPPKSMKSKLVGWIPAVPVLLMQIVLPSAQVLVALAICVPLVLNTAIS